MHESPFRQFRAAIGKPTTAAKAPFWQTRAAADNPAVGELLLYGVISSESWWGDEVTPKQFAQDLKDLGDISELRVFINSPGGDVFAGLAIHSMLKRHKAKTVVYVDGLAASAASVIAMAGDVVRMPRNAMMMIHRAWTVAAGNVNDFEKMAKDLRAIDDSMVTTYEDKTGLTRDEIIPLLDAETWLTAEDAVAQGFADEIEQSKQVAAALNGDTLIINGQRFDVSNFHNLPKLPSTARRRVAAAAPPTSPDDEDETPGPEYGVGERVKPVGLPHVDGHVAGEVREAMLTWVYGIEFDGTDGIFHWYVESEITDETPDAAPDPSPPHGPQGRRPAAAPSPSPVQRRNASLSHIERRLRINER